MSLFSRFSRRDDAPNELSKEQPPEESATPSQAVMGLAQEEPASIVRLENARTLYTGCPLCGSERFHLAFRGDCQKHAMYKPQLPNIMNWMECDDCQHMFIDGPFTEEALGILFSDTLETQKMGFDMHKNRSVSSRMIDKVLMVTKAQGYWLDIGFGNGSLVMTAAEYGFDAVGVDLRKDNVEKLRRLGLEAHDQDIMTFDSSHDGRYSVVSMADVLEHMPYPKQVLEKVHSMMKPDGVLLVSLPNKDSILWNVMTSNGLNSYLAEIEHYHNFGRKRLYALLEETGFEPLRYSVSERYIVGMEVLARKKA